MAMAGDSRTDALRQLATLNRIARIALQDMALQPMLQRIVDTLAEEFGWEFVACATIDHCTCCATIRCRREHIGFACRLRDARPSTRIPFQRRPR